MELHIRLYKNGIDVGGGYFKSYVTTSMWTPFTANFSTYTDADSARIMISACYDNDAPVPHGNSVLYIDNLSFDNPITAVSSAVEHDNSISVFPNPAFNELIIVCGQLAIGNVATISITAITGKVIYQTTTTAAEKLEVNTTDFAEGVYLVSVQTKDFIKTNKIIITK